MHRRARTEEACRGLHECRARLGGDLSPLSLLRVRQEATLEDHLDWPPGGGADDGGDVALDEFELIVLELADGDAPCRSRRPRPEWLVRFRAP